jgi:hypothetical protein
MGTVGTIRQPKPFPSPLTGGERGTGLGFLAARNGFKGLGKWQRYEIEKAKIKARNLPPQEYEVEIRKMVQRLKV